MPTLFQTFYFWVSLITGSVFVFGIFICFFTAKTLNNTPVFSESSNKFLENRSLSQTSRLTSLPALLKSASFWGGLILMPYVFSKIYFLGASFIWPLYHLLKGPIRFIRNRISNSISIGRRPGPRPVIQYPKPDILVQGFRPDMFDSTTALHWGFFNNQGRSPHGQLVDLRTFFPDNFLDPRVSFTMRSPITMFRVFCFLFQTLTYYSVSIVPRVFPGVRSFLLPLIGAGTEAVSFFRDANGNRRVSIWSANGVVESVNWFLIWVNPDLRALLGVSSLFRESLKLKCSQNFWLNIEIFLDLWEQIAYRILEDHPEYNHIITSPTKYIKLVYTYTRCGRPKVEVTPLIISSQ